MNEKYGSSRLNSLLESGKVDNSKLQMLDCYNQTVHNDVACTITTRVISCNHYYISEPVVWRVGYGTTRPVGPFEPGVSPTITSSQWELNNFLVEPMPDYEYKTMPDGNIRAYSPRRGDGKGVNGYHITNPKNIHPTITSAHEPLIMEQTENTDKVMQVGNILSSDNFDNPQRGRVFDTEGVSPTLDTAMGGDRQPKIIERVGDRDKEDYSVSDTAFTIPANPMSDRQQMVVEPQSLTRERTEEEKKRRRIEGDKGVKFSQSKQYTTRTDGISNTLTTCEKERMIVEPQAMGHYRPANRTSDSLPFSEYEHRPKDDGIANAVTAQPGHKDGLIAEPIHSDYQGKDATDVKKAADELRDFVQKHRPEMPIGVDVQPDGRLRPHIDNESNFGIMDYYTDHEQGTAGTQIATRPSAVYGTATKYRIRRLTPREVFRLMDVDEWAIDRILLAKDEKGKRLVSNSQCYKMGGNSITTNVLVCIFNRMFIETAPTKPYQLSLFD